MFSKKNKILLRSIYYSKKIPFDLLFCLLKLKNYDLTWRLYGYPLIYMHSKSKIEIGTNWTACSSPRYNSIGVFQKVIIKSLSPNSKIKIGNNVGMSGVSISCSKSITIGDNTLLGSGVLITDSDAHSILYQHRNDPEYIVSKPVNIGKDVFIGARAIILKGVTIGDGAVIGAGSVVSQNVDSLTIVAGNPARFVRKIF